jgi:hypothetical protein
MTDASIIAEFMGETLGAMFSFILYIFTEVNLWGVSLLHVVYILIAFMLFAVFFKVLLR